MNKYIFDLMISFELIDVYAHILGESQGKAWAIRLTNNQRNVTPLVLRRCHMME